ncbi:MAG: 16S rRNA methyltransferase [Spirochaetaceae bacterium]|jgi:16S rRNA (cytosine1407-C5)-methyltransferase|nr:16S rRNA methyltransferase [Spirochaetaceae bacterium]
MNNDNFDNYYRQIYGTRWDNLKKALCEKNAHHEFHGKLNKAYIMDKASVKAAVSLTQVLDTCGTADNAGLLLDACAAPGGKSLVLADGMSASFDLLANEISSERRRRLVNVLDDYLPDSLRLRVKVSGFDAASAAGKKSNLLRFAGILLDAPCSSERHVLANEKYLSNWTASRPLFLAQRQWALLSAAFLMLQPGAPLVYSTCAITSVENDNVAARLIKKYGDAVELCPPDFEEGEKTEYGKIILPDSCEGMGPMYVARFVKKK